MMPCSTACLRRWPQKTERVRQVGPKRGERSPLSGVFRQVLKTQQTVHRCAQQHPDGATGHHHLHLSQPVNMRTITTSCRRCGQQQTDCQRTGHDAHSRSARRAAKCHGSVAESAPRWLGWRGIGDEHQLSQAQAMGGGHDVDHPCVTRVALRTQMHRGRK